MKLFLRMIPAVTRGLTGPTLHPLTPLVSRFRVLPHDLDVNLHLNNGRYLQWIDVNRLEWLLRTRILQSGLRQKWRPLLGGSIIRFRRELTLFQPAEVETRLVGWDDRWFYLQHTVRTAAGLPVALCQAKAAFRARGSWVPSETVKSLVWPSIPTLRPPASVLAWSAADEHLGHLMADPLRSPTTDALAAAQAP